MPFLEDSWKQSMMRLSGTILGALVFGAAVILSGDNTVSLMVVGLVAAYAYILMDNGRYDRKMFFYTLLVMVFIVLGSLAKVQMVWDLSDLFNALMVIPNLIALLALGGVVVQKYREFSDKNDKK